MGLDRLAGRSTEDDLRKEEWPSECTLATAPEAEIAERIVE